MAQLRASIEPAQLPPFLRVLLTTDGTVTHLLEAYFQESVAARPHRQTIEPLAHAEPELGVERGGEVLTRGVTLCGKDSATVYARADSLVLLEALPSALAEGLRRGRLGIGELLRDERLESYREITAMGRGEGHYWRRYRIFIGGRPAMLITEQFPTEVYSRKA